jgi:RNA-binding protein NOB1
MGIPILCQDGFVVNQTRRFILECYVCKTIENDTSKLFCHECGNNALLKVSCSINSDGTIKLYRRKNFKVNLRGTQVTIVIILIKKFSIPKASESKYNQVIVRED